MSIGQMRVTRIDMDAREMPIMVTVLMTRDVWDRLCRDHKALRGVAERNDVTLLDGSKEDWWVDRFPITWVASVAKLYGRVPIDDAAPDSRVAQEIYRCLSSLCCRFWEGGAEDVPSPTGEAA